MELLPDDLKNYAEIVHSTLKEGPNAILSATDGEVVADVYCMTPSVFLLTPRTCVTFSPGGLSYRFFFKTYSTIF